MPNKPKLTESFLNRVYTQKGLSTWMIEKQYGLSRSSVYVALKRFGIPTRNLAHSHIRYARKNFSQDKLEEAYLLGFAIGDLRVRNHNKKQSETISIACGSTKKAQINLIEALFKPYGRVWKGQPNLRGVINIEAFVNKSFEFLLPGVRTYRWCKRTKEHFFSFLAGFTDAEGSFYLSQGKAFIAWGNYDKDILQFIRAGLSSYDIETPEMCCDKLAGYVGSHGFARNKNYCHVTICKKTEVEKLIKGLKPYLKHTDKLKRLAVIEKNINLRNTKEK